MKTEEENMCNRDKDLGYDEEQGQTPGDYWTEEGPFSIWDDPDFEDDWEEYYVDEEENDE